MFSCCVFGCVFHVALCLAFCSLAVVSGVSLRKSFHVSSGWSRLSGQKNSHCSLVKHCSNWMVNPGDPPPGQSSSPNKLQNPASEVINPNKNRTLRLKAKKSTQKSKEPETNQGTKGTNDISTPGGSTGGGAAAEGAEGGAEAQGQGTGHASGAEWMVERSFFLVFKPVKSTTKITFYIFLPVK